MRRPFLPPQSGARPSRRSARERWVTETGWHWVSPMPFHRTSERRTPGGLGSSGLRAMGAPREHRLRPRPLRPQAITRGRCARPRLASATHDNPLLEKLPAQIERGCAFLFVIIGMGSARLACLRAAEQQEPNGRCYEHDRCALVHTHLRPKAPLCGPKRSALMARTARRRCGQAPSKSIRTLRCRHHPICWKASRTAQTAHA